MEFTAQDRDVLFDRWMSYKSKARITQIEMAQKLSMSQADFSNALRGSEPLDPGFVRKFCHFMRLEPSDILPSMIEKLREGKIDRVMLTNTFILDGDIKNVKVEGNKVFVEYERVL
ncbi:XRE family transcriptional regulator [Vibrio stylophorae]|uniref:XRE family transcriptional regulator n=1 Tax=Vibrio stylophorae TaxID=659351 RepID=UPI001F2E06C8|nr:XRE family transcriptional regulator [Vibrio stylophorae]